MKNRFSFLLCAVLCTALFSTPANGVEMSTDSISTSLDLDSITLPLPDLTVSNVYFHRSNLTASAYVTNRGNARIDKTERFSVFFEFLDTQGSVVRTATINSSQLSSYYNGLEPGRAVEFQISRNRTPYSAVSAADALRIASVRATVDPGGNIDESDEQNNSVSNDADGVPPLPDLTIASASFNRTNRQTTVSVDNIGTTSVAEDTLFTATVEYFSADGELLATRTAPRPRRQDGLAPGRRVFIDFGDYLELSPETTERVQSIRAYVDKTGSLLELNEENNAFAGEVRGRYPRPDLAIRSASFNKNSRTTSVSVENKGTGTVESDQYFVVRVEYVDAAGEVIASASARGPQQGDVAPGRSTFLQHFMLEPDQRRAQLVDHIRAVVDTGDAIRELDETNNTWPLPPEPTPPPAPVPDIAVTAVTFDRGTFVSRATVGNIGTGATADAERPFTVEFDLLEEGGTVVGTARVPVTSGQPEYYRPMSPGGSMIVGAFTPEWANVSAERAARVATVRARLTGIASGMDASTSNNEITAAATGNARLPDVAVQSVSFHRESLVSSAVVSNVGTGLLPEESTKFVTLEVSLLDSAGSILDQATERLPWNSASLNPNTSWLVSFDASEWGTNPQIAFRTSQVRARLVTDGLVESGTQNNEVVADAQGRPATPDVAVTAVSFDRRTQTASVRVKNIGTRPADGIGGQSGVRIELRDARGNVLASKNETLSRGALAVGESAVVSINKREWGIDRVKARSVNRIFARVSVPESVRDFWPENNEMTAEASGDVAWPDLIVEAVALSADGTSWVAQVKNQSSEDAEAEKMTVVFTWLDDDGKVLASTFVAQKNFALPSGQMKGMSVLAPSEAKSAAFLRVSVDTDNAVAEGEYELNNIWEGVVAKDNADRERLERLLTLRNLARKHVGDGASFSTDKEGEGDVPLSVAQNVVNEKKVYEFLHPASVPGDVRYIPKKIGRSLRSLFTFGKEKKEALAKKVTAEQAVEAHVLLERGKVNEAKKLLDRVRKEAEKKKPESAATGSNNTAPPDELVVMEAALDATQKEIDKREAEAPKKEDKKTSWLDRLRGKKNDTTQPPKQTEQVPAAQSCSADEWNCNWNECVWTGPGTEQGKQTLKECYKVFDCATADTPAPQRAGDTKDCSISRGTGGGGSAGQAGSSDTQTKKPVCTVRDWTCDWGKCVKGVGTENWQQTRSCTLSDACLDMGTPRPADMGTKRACTPPTASCTADEWNCNWNACTWVGPGTEQGKQTLKECYKVFDCATADTPAPQRAGDTKDCSTPKPVASCTADEWNCNWNACTWVGPGTEQGEQTLKECYKVFDCSTATTPAPYAAGAKKACSASAPACLVDSWSCGAWTTCSADGTQTRTCTLSADCPTANTPRPATSQACVPPAASTPPAATTAPVYASTATAFIVTGGHVSPQRIDIAPGGTITFQNVDFETHVVRFSFGQSITLSPGSSQAVTAPTAQDLYNVYTDSRTSPNGLIVVSQ